MAAGDDDQERTLPATQRRLEQAREEGQVPRSRALASALVLGTAAALATAAGPLLTQSFGAVVTRGLTFDHAAAMSDASPGERLSELVLQAMAVGVPLCIALTGAGVLAAFLLGGWNFTTQALSPKWSRLNPLNGIGNMLSVNGLTELAKTLVEVVIVVAIIGTYLWSSLDQFAAVLDASTSGPMTATTKLVLSGFVMVVIGVAAGALFDVPLQIWRHGHNLRMSIEEVKRESRESDGDPQLKARIRGAQREMAKKRMMQAVPGADVVVTNPTHYAVALKYDEGRSVAPRVVALGVEQVAARIRQIARESGVPIVEAPPLARALYARGELEREIPPALYAAVAQVLAFVFQLRADRTRPSASDAPYVIGEVEVPPGYDPLAGHIQVEAH